MLREGLSLDHFYSSFTEEEINDLRGLLSFSKRCVHSKVESGTDTWEGIYLTSNVGPYFEMLLDPEQYGMGIAASSCYLQYFDGSKVPSDFPKLKWKRGTHFWGRTKKKWFTAISLQNHPHEKNFNNILSTWIMHYHPLHLKKHAKVRSQSSVERFHRLVVQVGETYLPIVRYHSQWLPGKQLLGKKKIELKLPTKDGGPFTVEIRIVKGNLRPRFVSLEMSLCPDARPGNPKMHLFEFVRSKKNRVKLQRCRSSDYR